MSVDNPWEPWGLIHTTRDGFPVLTETALWQLEARHPEAVERDGGAELFVHLDRTYRAVRVAGRSFRALVPAPERVPPAPRRGGVEPR